jgi:malto-oligosyltrehalose trehalohydrolase
MSKQPLRHAHSMPYGSEIDNGVRFQLWAPLTQSVELVLQGVSKPLKMVSRSGGWFETRIAEAEPGARYEFLLSNGKRCPDPASRFQPDGPHGMSEVIDPRTYEWRNTNWRGRPWQEAVLYEMHMGTFTEEGTFSAAIGKLDHLVNLGVTAVEVMPIAEFPGEYSWGYDGVLLFAPAHVYGRPDDFKAFVDACHDRSIMVILDVVYNHFGPDGNYLDLYTPLTTQHHKTPWGAALNFEDDHSDGVRDFFVQNALYWIDEFRLDGLRLDSINFIKDTSDRHVLAELAERVRALHPERNIHLVAENPRNQAGWLKRDDTGEPVYYTAQWSDDLHNTLHCMVTGESNGYYADYGRDPAKLARAWAEGFCYQGETVPSSGEPNGEPSAHLPPAAFISFLQNHDQIGNRPFGERIAALTDSAALKAIVAINLLSPHIPLLFMGEEWGSKRSFRYFADVREGLAQSIREGRQKEFREWYKSANEGDTAPPDPTERFTFLESKLDWREAAASEHWEWLALYTCLLRIRRTQITPRNVHTLAPSGSYEILASGVVVVKWRLGDRSTLSMVANLEPNERAGPLSKDTEIWNSGVEDDGRTAPWSVRFGISENVADPTDSSTFA